MVKYTLARVGMWVALTFALNAFLTDVVLSALISAAVTAVAGYFLLAKWRNEVASTIETSITKRRAEKEQLRSALAGDDDRNLTVHSD
jgi:hypothetical protein